jgi:hypothetical protein
MQLREEAGITRDSLHNARALERRWGRPVELVLDAGGSTVDHCVTAFYPGGQRFIFTGFAWGYGGEGPRGLCEFLRGLGFDVTMQTIASWPEANFGKRMVVGERSEG